MLFEFIGFYFSAMFLQARIAEKLYIRKRSKEEYEKKMQKLRQNENRKTKGNNSHEEVRHLFSKINFSSYQLITDPFWAWLCCCFKRCRCCYNTCWCFRRIDVLAKVSEKFEQELDLVLILKKIRDSNDILKHLQHKDQR